MLSKILFRQITKINSMKKIIRKQKKRENFINNKLHHGEAKKQQPYEIIKTKPKYNERNNNIQNKTKTCQKSNNNVITLCLDESQNKSLISDYNSVSLALCVPSEVHGE